MAWSKNDIHAAFLKGQEQGASHMIVAYDDFDYENYPIYVPQGEDPRKHVPSNGDRIDECYRLDLPWDVQSTEFRANHWEWVDPKAPLLKLDKKGNQIS